MLELYILNNDKEPVLCADAIGWAAQQSEKNNRVALDVFGEGEDAIRVSTVFLGIDHNLGRGRPHFFETMAFGHDDLEVMDRCSTWQEALDQHQATCETVKAMFERSQEVTLFLLRQIYALAKQ